MMNLIRRAAHYASRLWHGGGASDRCFRREAERLEKLTMNCRQMGVASPARTTPVVVSLTTYGRRLREVHLAIESIMQGSVKPDRIVLWLEEGLAEAVDSIPTLVGQKQRGLEIRFVPDLRSYKKIVFALGQMPEATIITIDDDQIYPSDMLEKMLAFSALHPEAVCANMVTRISRDQNDMPQGLEEWPYVEDDHGYHRDYFFEGFGGVLYPPHCFCPTDDRRLPSATDESLFLRLCPTADDVWLNAMVQVYGREVHYVDTLSYDFLSYVNPRVQDNALWRTNNGLDQRNERQMRAVWENIVDAPDLP